MTPRLIPTDEMAVGNLTASGSSKPRIPGNSSSARCSVSGGSRCNESSSWIGVSKDVHPLVAQGPQSGVVTRVEYGGLPPHCKLPLEPLQALDDNDVDEPGRREPAA
jgi:hypothetical protein